MADFEQVKAIRGARLSDLSQHVSDVLALNLAKEEEFQVGRVTMAAFDFAPYALTGLSAAMQTPASGSRASTHVTLPLTDDKGGTDEAEQDVTLYGPGDVLGIDPGQIVRRYPSPGSTNAEETFHAHIELDRPELPWAFSARTKGDQMPAWLALVVFERDEVEWEPAQAGLQPVAAVAASTLPPLGVAWAWAHAQAVSGSASLSARLSTAYAPVNVARLVAARILTQNTNYVACLVPTTDAGRRAGLGLTGGTLGPAWTPADGTVRLPVYDRWEFRTAPDGDFARLARRLKGVAAPWEIGRRTMDASRPGAPLPDLGAGDPGRRQVIRCAVFSPAPQPAGAPSDTAAWSAAQTDALQAALERPAVIEGSAGTDPGALPDLPIVGPRIYAKGQRGTSTIPAGDWFAELNLKPVHRVVGGLGTRVVVKDQEPLMQAAWAQVGEVDKANRELALAELARNLATSLHRRLDELQLGRLVQLTRPLAPRVRLDGSRLTLAGQTVRSATPEAALAGAFRRAVRVAGPIARRLASGEREALAGIVGAGEAARDFTRPYVDVDGVGGLSAAALGALDSGALATALGASPREALAKVTSASALLAGSPTLATTVTTPQAWRAPDTSFKPGAVATERVVAKIRERIPADVAQDVVASRWLGGLAAGVAVSAAGAAASLSGLALDLDTKVAAVPVRVRPGGAGLGGVFATAPGAPGAPAASPGAIAREPGAGVAAGPGALAATPPRGANALMLRGGALRGAPPVAGLSPLAAGGLAGAIVRPVGPAPGGGPAAGAAGERARLDRFKTPQGAQLASWIARAERVTAADVRAQISALVDAPGALTLARTPAREVLAVSRRDLMTRLEPSRTVIAATKGRLGVGALDFDPFVERLIRPIMAAPRFDRPMYQALDDYDREWLVPGLGKLKEPELVTLLSTNDEFTEAFLVGLSDEMGRELLWRGYPTDSRGTYFHRFWNPNEDELASQIHRFTKTRLGSHVTMGPPGQSGLAVVVIRGELVRRYPDLTVMALREQGRDAANLPLLPETPTGPPNAAKSLFHAPLPPDVMLAGLDITVEALRQPGWWIVLAEHPQATRFRRAERDLAGHEVRFANPGGLPDGAAVAQARIEHPTRIAFEAGDFLPSI